MKLELHVHFHADSRVIETLDRIERRLRMDSNALTAALSTIATGISNVGTQLTKSHDEIVAKLATLGQTSTTAEQDAIIASINSSLSAAQTTAQSLDDLVPDAAPVSTPPADPTAAPTA